MEAVRIMEIERAKRYRDKMNIILKRNDEINDWIGGYNSEDFVHDEKTKLATYKAFQEIVEASMDCIAMACKDEKIVPKDDYTNIESLGVIEEGMRSILIEANGLRNRLVHRYNHTDDILAFENMLGLLPGVMEFVNVVETWIRKKLNEE